MAETQGKQQGKKSIARNRSARHEYEIGETFECGLVLTGTEVKSLRERGCQLTDTFCLIRDGEAWIHGMHLHPYTNGGVWNVDPDRKRFTAGRLTILTESFARKAWRWFRLRSTLTSITASSC